MNENLPKDFFNGLEKGVLEVIIPEGASAIDYLEGYESAINEKGYEIIQKLNDVKNKEIYHLHFQKINSEDIQNA